MVAGQQSILEQKYLMICQLKFEGIQRKELNNTCEEGGAQLKISFWHLLMNLKNNY